MFNKLFLLLLIFIFSPTANGSANEDEHLNNLYDIFLEKAQNGLKQDKKNALQYLAENPEKDPARKYILDNIKKDPNFLVSDEILKIPGIPKKIKDSIKAKKRALKDFLLETARRIELKKGFVIKTDEGGISLEEIRDHQLNELKVNAEKSNLSIKSLSLAFELIISSSVSLFEQAKQEQDIALKYEKYVDYAVIVYELTDIAILMISEFKHEGAEELKDLASSQSYIIEKRMQMDEIKIRELDLKFKNKEISESEYEADKQFYEQSRAGLNPVLDVWNRVLEIVNDKEKFISNMKSNISSLEKIKEKHKRVLFNLYHIGVAKEVVNTIEGFDNILKQLQNVPILVVGEVLSKELLQIKSQRIIEQ